MTYRMASSGGENSASAPSGKCSSVLHHHRMRSAHVRAGSGLRISGWSESPDSDFELSPTSPRGVILSEAKEPRLDACLPASRIVYSVGIAYNRASASPQRHGGHGDSRRTARLWGALYTPAVLRESPCLCGEAHPNREPISCRCRPRAGCADPLGDVARHRRRLEPTSRQPDMAVRTQQVERRPWDPRAVELAIVGGIAGNHEGAQQIAEPRHPARRRRLPDHDQSESRVVELVEQVLGGTVRARA